MTGDVVLSHLRDIAIEQGLPGSFALDDTLSESDMSGTGDSEHGDGDGDGESGEYESAESWFYLGPAPYSAGGGDGTYADCGYGAMHGYALGNAGDGFGCGIDNRRGQDWASSYMQFPDSRQRL